MPVSPASLETACLRCRGNLARVNAIFSHADRTKKGRSAGSPVVDDLEADFQRAALVLLHATVEDLLRSLHPERRGNWNFNRKSDILKLLKEVDISSVSLEFYLPSLDLLAQRRQRIVHSGDIEDRFATAPPTWKIADTWLCFHWWVVAGAFVYALVDAAIPTTDSHKRLTLAHKEAVETSFEVGQFLIEGIYQMRDGDVVDYSEIERRLEEVAARISSARSNGDGSGKP